MEIRQEAAKNGLKLWEVAEAVGVADSTFSRKLRRELPSNQKDFILRKIQQIAEGKAEKHAKEVERHASHENLN